MLSERRKLGLRKQSVKSTHPPLDCRKLPQCAQLDVSELQEELHGNVNFVHMRNVSPIDTSQSDFPLPKQIKVAHSF
jgi:hypothetical protein